MIIPFNKYHGAGNDFIMIDNRSSICRNPENSVDLISHICNRRFGIGGNGLILLNNSNIADFEMVYFNSNGIEGTLCGNGGRCCVAFAGSLGIIKEKTIFKAVDGLHEAFIMNKNKEKTQVSLKMQDVKDIKKIDDNYILDTGSPHYVSFSGNVENLDVFNIGRNIRNSGAYRSDGINVNFAEAGDDGLFVRTYERGVEDETLSCGTGVVATVMAAKLSGLCKEEESCLVHTRGGDLTVRFKRIDETSFHDIWLEGIAVCVFKGEINI